jgi:hypothetical protein
MAARQVNGISALEMTMRDVMDNLEDLGSQYAYASVPGCFEILSIEPPEQPPAPARPSAAILTYPAPASADAREPAQRRAAG